MVNDIPNLNDRQKLQIRNKTSVLDCNNDKDWNNKAKNLNDFYNKGNKQKRNKDITDKVNNIDKKNNNNKDCGNHDNNITY